MLVFIACGKEKQNHPCKAEDLYIGAYFRKTLLYAKSLKPDKIYILSAKYGCVEPDAIIAPYEKTMADYSEHEKRNWAKNVYAQLIEKGCNFEDKAVFLCGNNYRKYIQRLFKNNVVPFKNIGIIAQMGEINKAIGKKNGKNNGTAQRRS